MTTTHEELRKLANEAIAHGEKIGEEEWISAFELERDFDKENANFVAAADPQTIRALLDEIAALKRDHAEEIALIDKLVQGK